MLTSSPTTPMAAAGASLSSNASSRVVNTSMGSLAHNNDHCSSRIVSAERCLEPRSAELAKPAQRVPADEGVADDDGGRESNPGPTHYEVVLVLVLAADSCRYQQDWCWLLRAVRSCGW
jgi:hypothetical protein